MTIKIAPSILAADFARLGEEIERIADHVDMLHVDVMAGHFVPNLSLGYPVIASIRKITDLYFDCHMMTSNPDWYIDSLVDAGGNLLSVHIEVFPDPSAVHRKAVEAGLDFGLVLNPQTPVEAVEPFLDLCNQVLVMSVEPGFGGQSFIPAALPKAEQLRRLIDRAGLGVDLQIDGGVTVETAPLARSAGVNVFVAGSAIFGKADPVAAVAALRNAIGG